MNIVVDENIPLMTVRFLQSEEHNVVDVRATEYEGIDDDSLWKLAQEARALFITTDKGFRRHRFESHNGILIVRLRKPNRFKIHQRVVDMMGRFEMKDWKEMLVVAQDTVHRVSYSPKR